MHDDLKPVDQDSDGPLQPNADAVGMDVPDPAGPPHPFNLGDIAAHAAYAAGIAVVAGGIAFVAMERTHTRCDGATRSSKLKWEERQLEIDRAAARDATWREGDAVRP